MKNCEKQDLIVSIENSIAFIESRLDSADKVIAFVFKKHDIKNLEKASRSTLQDLFNEIYAIVSSQIYCDIQEKLQADGKTRA